MHHWLMGGWTPLYCPVTDLKAERGLDSKIGRKSSKTDVVEEDLGGGASLLEARRQSVLAVRTSKMSLAKETEIFDGQNGRLRNPEMDEQMAPRILSISRD